MMPVTASFSDKMALDVQGVDRLRTKVVSGDVDAMRATAREFEAMMVNMLLKTMRETSFEDPEHQLFGSQATQMYRDLLDQQWSRKAAEGRGFGFADMLMRQFKSQQKPATAEHATGEYADTKKGISQDFLPQQVESASIVTKESKAQPLSGGLPNTAREFMKHLRPHAEAAAQRLGVPAEYVLAQAGLESAWGEREIKRADGSPSYNLFGIKAGKNWQGDTARTLTTEFQYGVPVKKLEPFRAYSGYAEAFDDYAKLLKQRYSNALETDDAKKFSYGLQQAGYASDPRYGEKLSRLIAQLA